MSECEQAELAGDLRKGVGFGATKGEDLAAAECPIKQKREITRRRRSARPSGRRVAEPRCLVRIEIDTASADVEDDRVVP